VDGAMIPTDNDTLSGLIDVVPVVPISSNHAEYLNYIESDLSKGSLTAGFTRGEASRATATEVTALMQYTASELGKMARDRDGTLEAAIGLYIRMLIPLIEDGESVVVRTEEGAKAVTVARLDADWTFYATDGGGTPMSDVLKKQQLIQLIPVLGGLGVTPDKVREEVIRLFDLPPTFNEVAPPPPAASAVPEALSASPVPEATTSSVIGGA
jgi:hypothetical protein